MHDPADRSDAGVRENERAYEDGCVCLLHEHVHVHARAYVRANAPYPLPTRTT